MGTVNGHLGRMRTPSREGKYAADPLHPTEYEESRVPCPYCHAPLTICLNAGGIWRLTRTVDGPQEGDGTGHEFIGDHMPATHVFVKCSPCDQGFSINAEGAGVETLWPS